jgi:hypothetical protein
MLLPFRGQAAFTLRLEPHPFHVFVGVHHALFPTIAAPPGANIVHAIQADAVLATSPDSAPLISATARARFIATTEAQYLGYQGTEYVVVHLPTTATTLDRQQAVKFAEFSSMTHMVG